MESIVLQNPPLPKSRKVKKKNDAIEEELLKIVRASANRDEVDTFFESCALRVKKLDPSLRSLVNLQILQVLYEAECRQNNVSQEISQPIYSHYSEAMNYLNME